MAASEWTIIDLIFVAVTGFLTIITLRKCHRLCSPLAFLMAMTLLVNFINACVLGAKVYAKEVQYESLHYIGINY